jgi:hypothetical protein
MRHKQEPKQLIGIGLALRTVLDDIEKGLDLLGARHGVEVQQVAVAQALGNIGEGLRFGDVDEG